jgi:hypothetical protein
MESMYPRMESIPLNRCLGSLKVYKFVDGEGIRGGGGGGMAGGYLVKRWKKIKKGVKKVF